MKRLFASIGRSWSPHRARRASSDAPRLDELLTRSVEQPLTLISAHAGTGKTALLASWATGRRDVAWLTVDRDDNWSPHFWQGVELALDGVLGASDAGLDTRSTIRAADHRAAAPAAQRRARTRRPARDREPGRAQGAWSADLTRSQTASARRRDTSGSPASDSTPAGRRPALRSPGQRSRVHRGGVPGPARPPGGAPRRRRRRHALRAHRGMGGRDSARRALPRGRREQARVRAAFCRRRARRLRLPSERDPRPSTGSPTSVRAQNSCPQAPRGGLGHRAERRPSSGPRSERTGDGELPHLEPGWSGRDVPLSRVAPRLPARPPGPTPAERAALAAAPNRALGLATR